jgi:two-component system uhpT operon response regulator UhpA
MNSLPHLDLAQEICVAIVDDHDAVRFGLKGACEEAGFTFCGGAGTVAELLAARNPLKCDVVVLDLSLADGSAVENNVRAIIDAGAQVLVFSIADKAALVSAALRAGAAGVVKKSQSMADLLNNIQFVANGVYVNSPEAAAAIDADFNFKEQANLSPRERQVLALYASGFALKQVAFELGVSYSTVKEHIDRVRSKYSSIGRPAGTKTELYLRALEDGLIDGDSL